MARIQVPKLHHAQQRVVTEAKRFNALMCGRRFGKTTLGIDRVADAAARGLSVGWFAPTYKLLLEVWREVELIFASMTVSSSVQERQIRLQGGGVIDFWSLDHVDAGRGRSYGRVVIDEAGVVRDLETAWQQAIRPTLADLRGDAWFLGTPKGRRFFWSLYQRGQSGDGEWMSWRFPTGFNPYINPEELEAARRDMPDPAYRQEFEGEPSEDSGNPFGLDAIRECVAPASEAEPYVWGWDLAKSVDWTVGIPLDESMRVTRAWQRFQLPWEETQAKILAVTEASALADSSGVGDPIVERLQRESTVFEGFKFTGVSKQQLMDGLRAAIQRREVRFPDGPIRAELEAFEYEYTRTGVRYSAPHGMHDDCVMALALAVQHYTANKNRWSWADWVPPSEARMAVLIQAELQRRDKALREELARRGMTMADLEEGRWEPLGVMLGRIGGW